MFYIQLIYKDNFRIISVSPYTCSSCPTLLENRLQFRQVRNSCVWPDPIIHSNCNRLLISSFRINNLRWKQFKVKKPIDSMHDRLGYSDSSFHLKLHVESSRLRHRHLKFELILSHKHCIFFMKILNLTLEVRT